MNVINYFKMDLRFMIKSIRMYLFFPLIAFIFIFLGNTFMGITYLFFFMIIFNAIPFNVEGNGKCAKLYYSMPSKISDMVKGRYLFSIAVAIIVWIFAAISIYYAYTKGTIAPFEMFLCVLTGAVVTIICMIQYPLYYKFDITKSRILSMVIYLLPAFIAFALPPILIERSNGMPSIDISQISIYLVIALIVVLASYVSYRVSYKICANKQL